MTDRTLSAAELDELEQAAHLRLLFHAEIAPVFAQARRTEAAERKIQRIEKALELYYGWNGMLIEKDTIRRALAED